VQRSTDMAYDVRSRRKLPQVLGYSA